MIVLRQLKRMSTHGSKLTLTPSADASRADTRPALYATVSSRLASHCAPEAMYVPSEQAPLPPASQFAAISSGIFACV